MPTLYKAQLIEPETPMLEIWERMFNGLIPNARAILDFLGFYAERGLPIPNNETELTEEEKKELESIARALMESAVRNVQMRDGPVVATLGKVANNPSLFFEHELPASVQWEMAIDYQRGDEKPGSFAMDIWGNEHTACAYPLEKPTEANIQKAAEAALRRINEQRTSGRPPNPANQSLAELLGKVFRATGHPIARRNVPAGMFKDKITYAEEGLFHEFLELVLPTLRLYLREQRLPPVTTDSIVRLAQKAS
jgi:hypothetical protein